MRRRLLAVEALVLLVVARIAIAVFPYRWLARAFSIETRTPELSGDARAEAIRSVQRAIAAAATRLPWESVCFPRAATAQTMLRRRGVATTLYYGAALHPGQGLTAHVWLQDAEHGVIGHETAGRYRILATYPDAPAGP